MRPILIAEDERPINDLIALTLRGAGYTCVQAYDGRSAADLIEQEEFDLAVLDIMLPEIDGYELLDYLRSIGTPAIFLTAKGSVNDRVRGLRLGADDYIVKPFEPPELVARVETVLRRCGRARNILTAFDVTLDPVDRSVTKGGAPLHLTPREFDLLEALMRGRGSVLYREVLYERVWGADAEYDGRSLDLHIQRLRKKLGWREQIRTVFRMGYVLEAEGRAQGPAEKPNEGK